MRDSLLESSVKISVVVPAMNEETRIQACIASVLSQAEASDELIVVANGCSDQTAALAGACACVTIELPEPGVGRARNAGAERASGDVLMFLDADSMLGDGVLEAIRTAVREGAVAGACDTLPLERTVRARAFWWLYNGLSRRLHKTNGCSFYRREVFFKAGGFHESLTQGEDTALHRAARRLGRATHLRGVAIHTSMRRFERRGYFRTLLEWELSFLMPRAGAYVEVRP